MLKWVIAVLYVRVEWCRLITASSLCSTVCANCSTNVHSGWGLQICSVVSSRLKFDVRARCHPSRITLKEIKGQHPICSFRHCYSYFRKLYSTLSGVLLILCKIYSIDEIDQQVIFELFYQFPCHSYIDISKQLRWLKFSPRQKTNRWNTRGSKYRSQTYSHVHDRDWRPKNLVSFTHLLSFIFRLATWTTPQNCFK